MTPRRVVFVSRLIRSAEEGPSLLPPARRSRDRHPCASHPPPPAPPTATRSRRSTKGPPNAAPPPRSANAPREPALTAPDPLVSSRPALSPTIAQVSRGSRRVSRACPSSWTTATTGRAAMISAGRRRGTATVPAAPPRGVATSPRALMARTRTTASSVVSRSVWWTRPPTTSRLT